MLSTFEVVDIYGSCGESGKLGKGLEKIVRMRYRGGVLCTYCKSWQGQTMSWLIQNSNNLSHGIIASNIYPQENCKLIYHLYTEQIT